MEMDKVTSSKGTKDQGAMAREGEMTKMVEQYTAQVPSIAYLGLAGGGILLSAALATFSRSRNLANFVGLWVPTILLVGIYNKLVKLEGSDQFSKGTVH